MKSLIRFVAFAAVAFSAALASAQDKVAIQLNWLPEPEFGGIYEAQRAGIFKKHGLEVEILKGGPDVPAVQMTASGRVQFGIASADEVITLRQRGGDIVGVFAIYQTSPQGIMVHAERDVNDIPSLLKAGGTIAVQPGLAYVKYLQKKHDMSKVKLVPYQGGVAQFLKDKNFAQQCFVFSEPLAAKKQGANPKTFLIADTGFNPYTGVVITSGDYAKEHPDVVKRTVAAMREGWRAYLDNPKPANDIMQKLNPSMDAETFAAASEAQKPLVETDETKANGLGSMTRERWQALAAQLVELGIVKKQVPAEQCFLEVK